MKKYIAVLLTLCLTLSLGAALAENTPIKVGASPSPHAEILEIVKPLLAQKGYDLQIVEFSDYLQPNYALENGELDANYFQHEPYLQNFNEENGTHLAVAFGVHLEPMLVFGGKSAALDAIKDGATIAVPNDPSNEARALRLLQNLGLLKLNEGSEALATKFDIDSKNSPYKVDIKETEAAYIPPTLQDVDFAVMNVNYALGAGLKAEDAIAVEPTEGNPNTNVVAVRVGDEEAEFTLALKEALQSDEVRSYIETTYSGAVIPAF